jgi:type II secretory pathway pseudopilin PulG
MVAIGIIMILVAVSIAGIAQLSKHTKAQRTTTALESAKSLLDGYRATDSTQSALKALYDPNHADYKTAFLPNGPGQDLDTTLVTGALGATKGPNGEHKWSVLQPNTQLAQELEFTARVMQVLLRVPENRQAVEKLPAEAKYVLTDDKGVALAGVPPLLADGNGEPILFVPPPGLEGVKISGTDTGSLANPILKSDGRIHPPTGPDPAPRANPLPFWVSSGPDRDFGTGDDNAYSFQQ